MGERKKFYEQIMAVMPDRIMICTYCKRGKVTEIQGPNAAIYKCESCGGDESGEVFIRLGALSEANVAPETVAFILQIGYPPVPILSPQVLDAPPEVKRK